MLHWHDWSRPEDGRRACPPSTAARQSRYRPPSLTRRRMKRRPFPAVCMTLSRTARPVRGVGASNHGPRPGVTPAAAAAGSGVLLGSPPLDASPPRPPLARSRRARWHWTLRARPGRRSSDTSMEWPVRTCGCLGQARGCSGRGTPDAGVDHPVDPASALGGSAGGRRSDPFGPCWVLRTQAAESALTV
jgi:hypothetical protein